MKKLLLIAACIAAHTYVGAQTVLPSEAGTVGRQPLDENIKINKAENLPLMLRKVPKQKRINLPDNQVIKKETVIQTLSDGSTISVLELADGTSTKRLNIPGQENVKRLKTKSSSAAALRATNSNAQTPTIIFTESFEDWDGEEFNWIPEDWVEESKTNQVVTQDQNLTWYANAGGNDFPTDGFFMSSIQVQRVNESVETVYQDEWLISPEMTLTSDNRIQFDLCFRPGWILFNSVTTAFTAENTTLQVLITSDNGATWTKLWDAVDEAKTFNRTELMTDLLASYGTWVRNLVDISAYAGKKVKVAFRFVGKDGEGMSLDNIIIAPPQPEPLYRRPLGTFYMGYTEDYMSLSTSFMLTPAYHDLTWYNYSSTVSDSFEWSIVNPVTLGTEVYTDTNLVANYPYCTTNLPVLTSYAMSGKYASSYQWGTANADFIQYGGNTQIQLTSGEKVELGAGNYDIYNYFDVGLIGENAYIFGTGSNSYWGSGFKVDKIANMFERPTRKYAFDKIWVHCLNLDADPDAQFKMSIYRIDRDYVIQEEIASSICYAGDAVEHFETDGYSYHSLTFRFKEIDEATGRERNRWIETEDAIFVELSFAGNKIRSFAPCFQALSHQTLDNYAYFYLSSSSSSELYSVEELGLYTSFLFNMNATYPFMLTDDNSYDAPAEGGTKEFIITSFYNPNYWKLNDLPDWITVGEAYRNSDDEVVLPVTVNPLSGLSGRSHNINITTYASDLTLKIRQGDASNINTASADDIKAIYLGDSYKLTYPKEFRRISVINTAGQIVAAYDLPVSGNFSIPASTLSKGVYILKFEGEKSHVIKVVR